MIKAIIGKREVLVIVSKITKFIGCIGTCEKQKMKVKKKHRE